jgi:cytochrome c-type biogenesis protein CcmH/NrfG
MDNAAQQLLEKGVALHRVGNLQEAATCYNQILNRDPNNPGVLYLLGDISVRQGCNGIGINLLKNSIAMKPSPEAYTALGVAYRHENYYAQAEMAWRDGLKLQETAELYNNIASIYSDHGEPDKALGLVEKSLALAPGNPNARWNKALALLTAQRWDEAWEHHDCRFDPNVQSISTRRNLECPLWDGSRVGHLAVHGEQGLGDEVMFMSMLAEALQRCDKMSIEVAPRLMDLVQRSFPTVEVYGTEAALRKWGAPFDAVVPLGSLGTFFRHQNTDFPGTPYLVPDPERVEHWRRQFAMQGPRPFIGVAWQGGTKETRIQQRTVSANSLSFCKRGTAISLQYGDHAQAQALEQGYLYYPESRGADLDDLAAMVAACDAVVTVAQTLVHVAGAVGVPTHVLTPLHSSWRYGMGDTMPWYNSVQLHRQKKADDWGKPLADVKVAIDKLCREFNNADK